MNWFVYRTNNGITAILEDDHMVLNGTATSAAYMNFTVPKGMGKFNNLCWYIKSDVQLGNFQVQRTGANVINMPVETIWGKQLIPNNKNYAYTGYLRINEGTTLNNCKVYIQVQEQNQAVSEFTYIPHAHQTYTFPLAQGQKLLQGDYIADDGIHHVRGQATESGTTITLADAKNNGEYKCNKKVSGNLNGQTLTFDTAVTDALIEYELVNEIIDPFTPAQQAVLEEIRKKAKSYKGGTHIYSTDEISPVFDVEYHTDLQGENENLQSQLDSLEARVSLLEGGE